MYCKLPISSSIICYKNQSHWKRKWDLVSQIVWQIWMFEGKWIYTKGKLCPNFKIHYFSNQSCLLLCSNMKKSLLRHIHNSISWFNFGCYFEWNSHFNLKNLSIHDTVMFLKLRSIITFIFLFLIKIFKWLILQEYYFSKTSWKLSFIAVHNTNWYSHFRKQFGGFLKKLNIVLSYNPILYC